MTRDALQRNPPIWQASSVSRRRRALELLVRTTSRHLQGRDEPVAPSRRLAVGVGGGGVERTTTSGSRTSSPTVAGVTTTGGGVPKGSDPTFSSSQTFY